MYNFKIPRRGFILSGLAAGPTICLPLVNTFAKNKTTHLDTFNFIGDGSPADFARFQEAIKFSAEHNSTLELPKKLKLSISQPLIINCSIAGRDSQISCASSNAKIVIQNNGTDLLKLSRISFLGCSLSSGISIQNSNHIEISDSQFYDFKNQQIQIDNCNYVTLQNLVVGNNSNDSLNQETIRVQNSTAIKILKNKITTFSKVGLSVENCSQVDFLNNAVHLFSEHEDALSSFVLMKKINATSITGNHFLSPVSATSYYKPSIHVLVEKGKNPSSPQILNNQYSFNQSRIKSST